MWFKPIKGQFSDAIETMKRNSKQRLKKIAPPFTSLPTKFKTRFYGPASLTDIIYCSFQAKFSRLVRKSLTWTRCLLVWFKSIKKTIFRWRSKHWKGTVNKRQNKIAPPFKPYCLRSLTSIEKEIHCKQCSRAHAFIRYGTLRYLNEID